jgi:carboxyl-terminal processing protease
MSPEARLYIDQVLEILQTHALNRNRLNWVRLREAVDRLAQTAQTPAETYPAIQFALTNLEDQYSYLIPAEEARRLMSGELDENLRSPQGQPLEDGKLAYLELPGVLGSEKAEEDYAIQVQRLIVELDASRPCGWVVDLRQNDGGNLWPMLAGVGPVLGEGLAGSFVYPDGTQQLWYYVLGRSLLDDEVQIGIESYIPYQLSVAYPLTAVLTGPGTMSSGEALVVAFRGRPNNRIFGQETAGKASANQTFVLLDGAWLQLAVALVTDRNGRIYEAPIQPDEFIPPGTAPTDMALQVAMEWLLRQPDCSDR